MLVYSALFIIISIFSFVNLNVDKKKMVYLYIGISAIIVFGIAFRDALGGSDYLVYKEFFNNIPPITELYSFEYFIRYEFAFELLNSIVKTFTDNYVYIFAVITFMTVPTFLYINFKYIKYPFFSLLFFIYKSLFYTFFVALRQSIAVVIFIIAIKYIKEKQMWKYFILVTIAVLFHDSAIILYPMYFINKFNLRKEHIIYYLVVALAISNFSPLILNIVGITKDQVLNLHMIEALLLFVIFYKFKIIEDVNLKVPFNLFFIYVFIQIAFGQYSLISSRFGMYFYFPIMILISSAIDKIKDEKIKKIALYISLLIFMLGLSKYLISFDNGHFLEYKNIFFR